MLNMKNRPLALAPCRQQPRDSLLGIGVVARPPLWMVESFLNINDQQPGTLRKFSHLKPLRDPPLLALWMLVRYFRMFLVRNGTSRPPRVDLPSRPSLTCAPNRSRRLNNQ